MSIIKLTYNSMIFNKLNGKYMCKTYGHYSRARARICEKYSISVVN